MHRWLAILLVLVAAAGLYWWTSREGPSPFPEVSSDVERCRDNLREIYRGLREHKEVHGGAPAASGTAFLGALIANGVWEATPENLSKLTCPGPNAAPVPPGTDFAKTDELSASSSAYAARDTARHPLPKFPSGGKELEPLVACDNARGMNHEGVMNVLFSDGQVKTVHLAQLVEAGRVPAETTTIPVGPGSPLEELRKLVAEDG